MTRTVQETVEHLTERSIAKHYYPLRDVDWDAHPITDDCWYMPPEAVTLYGTDAWERMDERQRMRLSLHEFVNACGLALWFENVLMRAFLDRLYDRAPDHPRFRYMLIEVTEEVQHNLLFAEFIRRSGIAWRGSRWPMRFFGRWLFPIEARLSETWLMTAVLVGEEIIEGINRATLAADAPMHPLATEVARIHRFEEARHMAYAKEFIASRYPSRSAFERRFIRFVAPLVAFGMTMEFTRGSVYRAVGLERPGRLFWTARRNPQYRALVHTICGRLEPFFTKIGILTPYHRRRWVRLGLLSKERTPAVRDDS